MSGVRTNQKHSISFFDTENLRVEEIIGSYISAMSNRGASARLVKCQVLRVQSVGEVLHGHERFRFYEMSCNSLEFILLGSQFSIRRADLRQRLLP